MQVKLKTVKHSFTQNAIIEWLLQGDVSIQYQVWRDLLQTDDKKLQESIALEGWGSKFLLMRNADGYWGERFYQPKWISTHYTLLDLRNLNLPPNNKIIQETIELILDQNKALDGGIRLGPSTNEHSDICVNGMFLNYASYFHISEKRLESIIDSILKEIMPDGGFNCRSMRSGAKHSSLHSTLSVLEGFIEFQKRDYSYRKKEISNAIQTSIEFILMHRLYFSDRTGEIIDKKFLKMPYPSRWYYDILRAMDFMQYANIKWDPRMSEALTYLNSKKNKDGSWNLAAPHSGKIHFSMEKSGKPSRWSTLRMLRILKHYGIE